jgi:hypothetical protein
MVEDFETHGVPLVSVTQRCCTGFLRCCRAANEAQQAAYCRPVPARGYEWYSGLAMKPRHAAAVVLAGWYLMVPPKHQSGVWSRFGMQFADTNAPLNKWLIAGVFKTARECEAAMAMRSARQREGLRCIGADDPRLAK